MVAARMTNPGGGRATSRDYALTARDEREGGF
jgi:hypothetical protein